VLFGLMATRLNKHYYYYYYYYYYYMHESLLCEIMTHAVTVQWCRQLCMG